MTKIKAYIDRHKLHIDKGQRKAVENTFLTLATDRQIYGTITRKNSIVPCFMQKE